MAAEEVVADGMELILTDGKVLAETMETFDEIERLFTEGAKEAGERAKAAGVAVNRRSIQRLLCLRLTR